MIAILFISVGISLAYILLISRYISGWNSIPEYQTENVGKSIDVSVIIVFRNEEKNLPALIMALQDQTYPLAALEIIFADDHSDDLSVDLVKQFITSGANARLIRLEKQDKGKKKALGIAAAEARGQLLIFTDADCLPGKDWIKTIVSFYMEEKPVLIAAPVIIKPVFSFFERFQSLEFFSLLACTAGSFGIHDPVMANGANLTVERDTYLESINYLQNRTTSGDDIFLLMHLKKKYSAKLVFLKSLKASVSIRPLNSVFDFVHQRLRWTSKSKYYRDRSLILSAVIVLLTNFWLFGCFIMSFFNGSYIFIGGGVFLGKTIIDFVILRKVLKFFRLESLLKIFVLSQFLYFLYISFIGIAGNFLPSKWKGRSVK